MSSIQFSQPIPAFGTSFPKAGVRFGEESGETHHRQFHSHKPIGDAPTENAHGQKLNPFQRLLGKMIHAYKKSDFIHDTLYKPRSIHLFGKEIPVFGGIVCGFKANGMSELSCSEYGAEAIQEKGAVKGSLLTLGRVLSCNPLTAKPESKIGQKFIEVA